MTEKLRALARKAVDHGCEACGGEPGDGACESDCPSLILYEELDRLDHEEPTPAERETAVLWQAVADMARAVPDIDYSFIIRLAAQRDWQALAFFMEDVKPWRIGPVLPSKEACEAAILRLASSVRRDREHLYSSGIIMQGIGDDMAEVSAYLRSLHAEPAPDRYKTEKEQGR